MKKSAFAILAGAVGLTAAHGQGLLSIGANNDFEEKVPFSVTVASSVGWDSNMNSSSANEHESGYWQNGISVYVPMGDRRNHLNVGAHYSNIWYFDPAPGSDDVYHNGRFTLDFVRAISPRLTVANSFYLAYETEPDYLIGASTNRRVNQYLYGYNNLSVTYLWTPRFSTVTGYTITGVKYDDDQFSGQDRLTHIISQQFRYALSRTTSVTADYRFQINNYDSNPEADSTSHFALVGVDHSFSPRLAGSARVGAEFRDYDGALGDSTAPYLEAALTYRAGKNTTLRWFHFLGLDDSDLSGFSESYSYRTGLSAEQRLTERLSGNVALHYVHTEYSDSPVLDDLSDDLFAGSVGLDYRVWRNISLTANYWYTVNSSDNADREFDRHRVSLGVTATF